MTFVTPHPTARAFSLLEVVAVTAVIGLLASASYFVFSSVRESASEKKLLSEVGTLNTAVASYLSFGGSLDDADTSEKVLSRLRSTASSDLAKRIPGLSSAMIDQRMKAEYQTKEQAGSDQLRVLWNPTAGKFVTATSGDAGICGFYLADESEIAAPSADDKRVMAMLYAKEDTWVWDYQDGSAAVPNGPTSIVTGNPVDSGSTPPTTPTGPGTPETPEVRTLAAPEFSIESGEFEVTEFDLPLTLTNPNPAGASDIFYSIDFGPWKRYTDGSTLEVQPDQTISAQTIAKTTAWTDSSRKDNLYNSLTKQLDPPTILTSSSNFGSISNRLVGLILQNPNPESESQLQYQINDGPWVDYENYLLLDRAEFAGGANISARVIPKVTYYEPSNSTTRIIAADPISLTGNSSGEFNNATGEANLVTNLVGNVSNNYFEWGNITNQYGNAYNGFSKSTLQFNNGSGYSSGLGERFYLGSLDYHNGTTLLGTNATNVDFDLALNFAIAGSQYGTGFDFDFDIRTTTNTDNAWESADFVAIDRSNSTSYFEIDGSSFELTMTFGETTSEGFSSTDSFHVFEDGSATANVYATVFDRTQSRGNVNADGSARSGGMALPDLEATANQNGGWWGNLWSWLTSFAS